MALYQSKQIKAGAPIPNPSDGTDYVPVTGEFVVPTGGLSVNDVIEFGGFPYGTIIIGGTVHFQGMGAGATADWGFLSGSYGVVDNSRTCGNDFAAAFSVAADGIQPMAKPQFGASQTDESTQGWGLKVTGAGWTAGQKIRATLTVRPAPIAMT